MLKDKFIIINIPFNNLGYNENRLTKEWITSRMDIFYKFTLKSLQCQTNQNFKAFINCDEQSMVIIKEALEEREPLPSNVQFIDSKQNTKLICKAIKDYEYLYLVRIDSDNSYHKDFVQILYDLKPNSDTEALLCQYGYLYDVQADQLAYNFHPSPSYYTFIYKAKEYCLGKRYILKSHTKVISDFKVELLNDYYYITTITGENVLFAPRHMLGKKVIDDDKKIQIITEFGLVNE